MTETRHSNGLAVANLIERIGHLSRIGEQIEDLYPAQWSVLRFLQLANEFSRTPTALTRYLGTTRGTMSQTVIALERKGYVERVPSRQDKRSVDVRLTAEGLKKLKHDPALEFSREISEGLGDRTQELRDLLESILGRLVRSNGVSTFGYCRTCRHFAAADGHAGHQPHWCRLLDVGLSLAAANQICVEHEFR